MQCKIHFTNWLMVAVEETMQDRFFSFLQQNSSAIDGNSSSRAHNPKTLGARRRELSTPQGRFREGYRKIPHESRPTSEMSNATMSKHSDDFSLLTNLFSRRTFSNGFPGNCVLNCRWDRVATTYITRDIDDQSFRTFPFTRLSTARYDDFFRM